MEAMEDNIFDKIFEEKLNTPQEYEFHEAAWLDVEKQLPSSSKRRLWWLAAASIALPMLMLGAYFYTELASANNEIVALKKKVETLLQTQEEKSKIGHTVASIEGATQSPISKNNTLEDDGTQEMQSSKIANRIQTSSNIKSSSARNQLNKKQLNKKDSKRNTIVLNEELEKSIADELIATKTPTSDQYNEFAINNYGVNVDENAINKVNEGINQLTKTTRQPVATIRSPKSLKSIVRNTPKRRISSYVPLELVLANEKAGKSNPILFFKPEGYKIGLTANGASIISQYRGQTASYGIVGEVLFSNNISMGMGVEYSNTNHLHLNWNTPDLPVQAPLEVGDRLKRIALHTDWIQVPIYLKYVYERVDKSVNPYIRIGGIMKRSMQQQYVFVFESLDNPEEYKREAPPEDVDNQTFAMNTINAGLGIDYSLTENINLQLETYVNHDMVNKDITTNLDMVGLQASVTCSF